jgi:TrmH family RNA methyltransferase
MTNTTIEYFIFCPECIYTEEAVRLVEIMINKTREVHTISKKNLKSLSERDDPDGMLSIGTLSIHNLEEIRLKDNSIILILDGLETPGNIGTILRSCEGASVDAVFVCNKKTSITHSKVIKGSMGAAFILPIFEFEKAEDCIKWLKDHKFNIYLADTRADKYYNAYEYTGKTAVVLGNERYGISKQWYNCNANMLSIPMFGICDSLNVGIAASIIAYEICMKKKCSLVE